MESKDIPPSHQEIGISATSELNRIAMRIKDASSPTEPKRLVFDKTGQKLEAVGKFSERAKGSLPETVKLLSEKLTVLKEHLNNPEVIKTLDQEKLQKAKENIENISSWVEQASSDYKSKSTTLGNIFKKITSKYKNISADEAKISMITGELKPHLETSIRDKNREEIAHLNDRLVEINAKLEDLLQKKLEYSPKNTKDITENTSELCKEINNYREEASKIRDQLNAIVKTYRTLGTEKVHTTEEKGLC